MNGTKPIELAPHSVEAEEAVLGSILLDGNRYDDIAAFLTEDKFFIMRNAWIFEAMTAVKNRGDAIDNLTVMDEMGQQGRLEEIGGGAYLTYLLNNTPTSLHAGVYGRIVERAHTRRKLLAAAAEIAQQAVDSDIEAQQAVDNAVELVTSIARDGLQVRQNTGVDIGDVASKLLADFYDPNPPDNVLPTGIPGLDNALSGGYEVGHHMVIAASGTGKTILLGNMALNFAIKGKNVLYILMESNEEFVTRRMLGTYMKINPEFLKKRQVPPMKGCNRCAGKGFDVQIKCSCRQGEGHAASFGKVYEQAVNEFKELPLRIVKTVLHLNTWRHVVAAAERDWKRRADVVIIDYGQNVALPGGVNPNDGHARFGNELTEMSINEDKYVFTALQVKKENDAGIKRPPSVNDINGTSKWFNVADTMITLFREPIMGADGSVVGPSEKGLITMPKLRDMTLARPVPVTLVSDGLFFAELEGVR